MKENWEQYVGKKFNRLTVLKVVRGENKYNRPEFLCRCDCGKYTKLEATVVKRGITKSCGCLHSDVMAKRNYKHGLTNTRIHHIWNAMIQRCRNPNTNRAYIYRDRGIQVCDSWMGEDGFIHFYEWSMANGYASNLTIDRIDNSKGYSPENCRWATTIEQANNKSTNHFLTFNGETMTTKQWANKWNVNYKALWSYLKKHGWDMQAAYNHYVLLEV